MRHILLLPIVLLIMRTLGVVGVVGVFVAKIVGHFGGPKGAKFHREAPICSSSQLRAMAVLSSQKVSAKKMWKF